MKRLVLPAAVLAALVFSAPAHAESPEGDSPRVVSECAANPCNLDSLTPEKCEEVRKIMREYAPKLADMRDKIRVKHIELKSLAMNQNATEKSIRDVSRELDALMDTRRGLLFERQNKLETITGCPMYMKHGFNQPCGRPGPRGDKFGPHHGAKEHGPKAHAPKHFGPHHGEKGVRPGCPRPDAPRAAGPCPGMKSPCPAPMNLEKADGSAPAPENIAAPEQPAVQTN